MPEYYSHLLECTMCDDTQRVYTLARGVDIDSLSGAEKQLLEDSKAYLRGKEIAGLMRTKASALRAFERLRDLPGMPDDAIAILREWTTRPGDEDDGREE